MIDNGRRELIPASVVFGQFEGAVNPPPIPPSQGVQITEVRVQIRQGNHLRITFGREKIGWVATREAGLL